MFLWTLLKWWYLCVGFKGEMLWLDVVNCYFIGGMLICIVMQKGLHYLPQEYAFEVAFGTMIFYSWL